MKTRLAVLALTGLALGGCYGPYGEPNVAGTALLGAGVGAVAGAAIAESASPGPYYYGPPRAYYAPPPRYYGYGYGYGPRYHGYRRW
jgi:hypothetical protein